MTRKKLFAKATEAGLQITTLSNHTIVKRGGVSVIFYEDGTQHRNDVRLDLAKRMTVSAAAKLLKLL